VPDAKKPTVRLKLSGGQDSLKQSMTFVERYAAVQ